VLIRQYLFVTPNLPLGFRNFVIKGNFCNWQNEKLYNVWDITASSLVGLRNSDDKNANLDVNIREAKFDCGQILKSPFALAIAVEECPKGIYPPFLGHRSYSAAPFSVIFSLRFLPLISRPQKYSGPLIPYSVPPHRAILQAGRSQPNILLPSSRTKRLTRVLLLLGNADLLVVPRLTSVQPFPNICI
jgi:hypothetical protein